MDPIVVLLVSQLALIVGILLTTSKLKNTENFETLKTRFKSYLASIFELNKDEDILDSVACAAEPHQRGSTKQDDLVILEKCEANQGKTYGLKYIDTGKNKRKKKPNSKFNGYRINTMSKASAEDSIAHSGHLEMNEELNNVAKWTFLLKFLKTITKFVARRIFMAHGDANMSLDHSNHSEISSKLQHGKLIESSYLIKIIAARKTEKLVRSKVAWLDMLIVKARKARPLQTIPELIEQDD